MSKNEIARDSREKRAAVVELDFCASMFDELAVFDAGGAGCFAGAAVEALIDVLDEGIGDGLVVQFDVNHLADATARGIGFEIPEAVGGAGIEAQAAVRATGKIFVDRRKAGDSVSWHDQTYDRGRIAGTQQGVARGVGGLYCI